MHTLGIQIKNRKSQQQASPPVSNWKSATEKRKQLSLHVSCTAFRAATPFSPCQFEGVFPANGCLRDAATIPSGGSLFYVLQHTCSHIFNMFCREAAPPRLSVVNVTIASVITTCGHNPLARKINKWFQWSTVANRLGQVRSSQKRTLCSYCFQDSIIVLITKSRQLYGWPLDCLVNLICLTIVLQLWLCRGQTK